MAVERNDKGQLLPGSVLNPGGRPRDTASKLEAMLAAATAADVAAIMRCMVKMAKAGDVRAADFVFDRLFGKPIQRAELTGKDREPLVDVRSELERKLARVASITQSADIPGEPQ